MKKYIWIITLFWLCTGNGCKEEDHPGTDDMELAVTGINVLLDSSSAGEVTRATGDYAANSPSDPTATLLDRTDWVLDLQVYNGNTAFLPKGEAHFELSGGNWDCQTPVCFYFPDYNKQKYEATVYHSNRLPTEDIGIDQSDANKLLIQDVLSENPSATITPAKIPTVVVEHAYSMLDFRLGDVDPVQVDEVLVEVTNDNGTTTIYKPYELPDQEYMLILPVGTAYPVILFTTTGGIEYRQTVAINGTKKNECYCFTLSGIELILSPIVVKNWSTGEALAADNTAVTAYPTFRGYAGLQCELTFDNGLTQEITFNSQSEYTVKPAGRIIVAIKTAIKTKNDLNIVLRDMLIDLTVVLSDMI